MRAPAPCHDSLSCAVPDSTPRARRPIAWLWNWPHRLAHLMQLRRERHQLLELSDHQLRDIGLTRREVAREARRHFWEDIGWRR